MQQETNDFDSTCGISDDELTRRFVEGVRLENEKKRILGVPVPMYDSATNRAYLEYADGTKEYASSK
jgi:hypothetical protein